MEYKYFQAASTIVQKVGKAVVSDLKLLQREIEHGANQLYRAARPQLQSWIVAVRSFSFSSASGQRAQAVIFGAAILTASVLFGLVMRAETHAEQPSAVRHTAATLPASTSPRVSNITASVLPPPVSPFTAKEFDFDAAPQPEDSKSYSDAAAPTVTAAVPKVAVVNKSRSVRASSVNTKKSHVAAHPTVETSLAQITSTPAAPAAEEPQPVATLPLTDRLASTTLLALQPVPVFKTSAQPTEALESLPNPYLEVGSFNDSGWADSAVNRLSQMGLPARAVRKSHLWAQSYRVEVGPFKTLSALEAAEKALTDKGFKPHAVK